MLLASRSLASLFSPLHSDYGIQPIAHDRKICPALRDSTLKQTFRLFNMHNALLPSSSTPAASTIPSAHHIRRAPVLRHLRPSAHKFP